MFKAWGNFVFRQRWLVLAVGVIFLIISAVYGTTLFSKLKSGGFYDPNADSTKVMNEIPTLLGRDPAQLLVLFSAKDNSTVDSPIFQSAVQSTLAKVQGKDGVGTITTFYSTGATQLVSSDKHRTYAVVGLTGDDDKQAATLKTLRPLLTSSTLQVQLSGSPAINEEISNQVSKDLETAESASFPILAVLLIIIFGSLVASVLPLAVGGLVIMGAFLVLRIVANFSDISIFAINVITILGLGMAIDYSLFMVSRFREELMRQNDDVNKAIIKTMQTAGRTVVFSAMTVIISLLSLLVFPQMFLQSMGLGGAAAVAVAMLAALTILPAMLALLGRKINALSIRSLFRRSKKQPTTKTSNGFWYTLSEFVMKRPVSVIVVTLVILIWVGLPFIRVNLSATDERSLPMGSEARTVLSILNTDFPRNETTPIQILVTTNGNATSAANLNTLYDYTHEIQQVAGVRRVDSLVTFNPQMQKADYVAFYANAPQANQVAAQFAKGNYTLINVLYDSDTQSAATQNIVRNLRKLPVAAGMSVLVGGQTAYLVDLLNSLAQSIPVALALIIAAVFVLLFLMLGSLVVPLKAVLLNVLSLSVSFGALVWGFQDGNLAGLLNFTSTGSIDSTQPVLVFAIAFGLSMDYEVFLLSRIKENYERTGDTRLAVATGVQKTGGIITSAAILLVVVIGSFMTGQILFIKQIGLGLGLAVLVDATIVRTLLVPATMRLLGRYNWWSPRPLAALYKRLNLAEVEHDEVEAEEQTRTLVEV